MRNIKNEYSDDYVSTLEALESLEAIENLIELEALEALENLDETAYYGDNYTVFDQQAYLTLKIALKRNEPMKIIFTRVANTKTGNFWNEPTCPICKSFVINEDKFCHECGQKLDWSDEK